MRNIIFFDFLQGNQIEMPIMFGIVDIIIFFCSIALVAIVARMVFLACGIHRPSDMKIIRRLLGGNWRYIEAHDGGPVGLNLPFSTWVEGYWRREKKEKKHDDENYHGSLLKRLFS